MAKTPATITYYAKHKFRILITAPASTVRGEDGLLRPGQVNIPEFVEFVAHDNKGLFQAPFFYVLHGKNPRYADIQAAIEGGEDSKGRPQPVSEGWAKGLIWTEEQAREDLFAKESKDQMARKGLIHVYADAKGIAFADAQKELDGKKLTAFEIRTLCEALENEKAAVDAAVAGR